MDKTKDKRVKNKIPEQIRNGVADVVSINKSAGRYKHQLQCKCSHIGEDGRPAIYRHGSETSSVNHHPLFVCRICKKYLDIDPITDEELDDAIDKIDRTIDIIKIRMAIRPDSPESDIKAYKHLSKTQNFLTGDGGFRDLARAAKKRNKKKSGGSNGGGFVMGRPS